MTKNQPISVTHINFYLFGSRAITHVVFWLTYYLTFSLIWMKNDQGYFASFYLEFILLPARMLAVYCMIYFLIPRYLVQKQYQVFFTGYVILLIGSGILQRLFSYFFYEHLLIGEINPLINLASLSRSILLINSTVIFVSAVKIFQLYIQLADQIATQQPNYLEVKSNRRIHRIDLKKILYIEGLGNYVTYHVEQPDLNQSEKIVVYSSIKATLSTLPNEFIRLHRSYIINTQKIDSYNNDNVQIGENSFPRAKDVTDEMLRAI